MTVKLIAENLLDDDDFSAATEEEGEYWDVPTPDSGNSGNLGLQVVGAPENFSYSGVATSTSSATAINDSSLRIYGDDFFIGASVEISVFTQSANQYTEQDAPGRVTITDYDTVTVANLDQDEEVWLYEDKGAAAFDGDFEFHVDLKCTANNSTGDYCCCWMLSNSVDDGSGSATIIDLDAAGEDFLYVMWKTSAGSDYIQVGECNGGSVTQSDSDAVTIGTQYYLKIVRDESVGTYGTLYCYIYTDSDHSTLFDTVSVTLTENQDFRYLFWMNNYENGGNSAAWDGVISNLEIVPSASQTQTVTDFAQSSGQLTTAAWDWEPQKGTSFTLTLNYSSVDFMVELTGSGALGDATFKWSHDDGTTYFGRDDPSTTNWDGLTEIDSDAENSVVPTVEIAEMDNGNLFCVYHDESSGDIYYKTSSDDGMTWGSSSVLDTTVSHPTEVCVMRSGRIWVYSADTAWYSDDNSENWIEVSVPETFYGVIELASGTLLGLYTSTSYVYCKFSYDGGFTWTSSPVTVHYDDGGGAPYEPRAVQAENGDVIAVYSTDDAAVGDYQIECAISVDGGATWGASAAIIEYDAADFRCPSIVSDIDGTLYCAASDGTDVRFVYSTDYGVIWDTGSGYVLQSDGGGDSLNGPYLTMYKGHDILCAFDNATDGDYYMVRRGYWELFSSGNNDAPCAIEGRYQHLIAGMYVRWFGSYGISGDKWTIDLEHYYRMENLLTDSPKLPYRSTQDNVDANVALDMGSGTQFYADGIGLFNCNVRDLTWGLVAYYRFNESSGTTAEDDSGNDFDATLYNTPAFSTGQLGNALDLNTPDSGTDLVSNGGFETDADTDGIPDDWSADNSADLDWHSADQNSGSYCLEINENGGNNPGATQSIALTDSTYYLITYWVKEGTGTSYRVLTYDSTNGIHSGSDTGTLTATSAWVKHQIVFQTPAGMDATKLIYLRHEVSSGAGTNVLFDDVSVVELKQYAQVAHDSALDFTSENFSISCWVKASKDQDSTARVVDKGNINTSGWSFWVTTTQVALLTNQSGSYTQAYATVSVCDDTWHHIVGVRNGSTATFYVDGTAYTSDGADLLDALTNSSDLYIGKRQDASGLRIFSGLIDELRIYNRALSSTEVTALYNLGDESINFDVTTGTVDSVAGNAVKDTALLASYDDHYFATAPHYLRMTSGTDDGVTWNILDNVDDYFLLDDSGSNNIAAADTFAIFQDHIAMTFDGGINRYCYLYIPAQHTADDYYQVGSMVVGRVVTLSDAWAVGYGKDHIYDINMSRTPQGGLIPIKGADRKRRFRLNWLASDDGREELLALLDYVEGKNIVLIPDDSDLSDCYLVKLVSPAEQRHRIANRFDLSIVLEEV